jgi:mttA/Hcf106 family
MVVHQSFYKNFYIKMIITSNMIGSTELIAILIAALFLFGPQKLPQSLHDLSEVQ